MNIRKEKTIWVFLLPVPNKTKNPEDRHIYDLIFGVSCVESSGVSPDDVLIVIDGEDREKFSQMVETRLTRKQHVYSSAEAMDFLGSYSVLMLFIYGHGHPYGLASQIEITPYKLVSVIQSYSSLQTAVVYFGPCFSGVFNYMPISNKTNGKYCNIIFIGGTQFHTSIAVTTTETINGQEVSWIADIFMWCVSSWFQSPKDIDGDGKTTLMDSFKYAGVKTNNTYQALKIEDFSHVVMRIPQIDKKLKKIKKQYFQCKDSISFCIKSKWGKIELLLQSRKEDLELQYERLFDEKNHLLSISMFNQQEP
jgi:hypothetical protein